LVTEEKLVTLDLKVLQDAPVQKVLVVLQVHLGNQDQEVFQALPDHQETKVLLGKMVKMVLVVPQVPLVLLVHKDLMDAKVKEDYKAQEDYKDCMGQKVLLVLKGDVVQLENRAIVDLWDAKVQLVKPVLKDSVDPMDIQEEMV